MGKKSIETRTASFPLFLMRLSPPTVAASAAAAAAHHGSRLETRGSVESRRDSRSSLEAAAATAAAAAAAREREREMLQPRCCSHCFSTACTKGKVGNKTRTRRERERNTLPSLPLLSLLLISYVTHVSVCVCMCE